MMDKIANDAQLYTDIQGLESIRGQFKKNPDQATDEVAKQFESILMQLVLTSMRNANKAFTSEMFGSNQMEMYQDLFDKQLSLLMSDSKSSFSNSIKQNLANMQGKVIKNDQPFTPANKIPVEKLNRIISLQEKPPINEKKFIEPPKKAEAPIQNEVFDTPKDFIKKLLPLAKQAASAIGVNPGILLAQAALETNWGKNILKSEQNGSSYNLFNIKSGSNWAQAVTSKNTLEEKNGVLVQEKSAFRSYNNFNESFTDYLQFLKENGRYKEALAKVANPKEFVQALQQAGYATDSSYAEKIWQIFSSQNFNQLISKE